MSFFRNEEGFLGSKIFLQIVSFLVAFLLWVYVNGDIGANTEKELSCDVHFLNPSSELTMSVDSRKVDVGVVGSREAVAGLTPRDVLCEVDIRGMGPGKYRLPVKVVLPGTIRLNFVNPAHLEVSLVRYGERVLPVHVSIAGGLPAGLLMDGVEITPKEISVRGPEEDISSVEDAVIQPTVEDLQKGEKLILPVKLVQSDGESKAMSVNPVKVELIAILRKGLPRKTVPVEVSVTGEPEPNSDLGSLTVSPSFVEIEGPEKAIKAIEKVETETIDLTGFSLDRSMIVPLRPLSQKEVQIIGESSVSVNIALRPKTATKLFSKIPVVVRGRSVYPEWSISPQTVDVRLEGPAGIIDSLASDDVPLSVYVDVTNIVSRQLRVPVTVKANVKGLGVMKVEPERVTVRAKID